jgi:predicted metalloprotease with PDZ domain
MRLIWRQHGLTLDGISEDGLDALIHDLLGHGFTQIWEDIKTRYIFGTQDIPLQKWIASSIVSIKPKSLTKLEKIKLQLGMRHTESQGWLKVTHILDGGAAQAAGLAPGDLLASINGQRVTSARWDKLLSSLAENENATVLFYRDDLEHERSLHLQSTHAPLQFELLPANTSSNR